MKVTSHTTIHLELSSDEAYTLACLISAASYVGLTTERIAEMTELKRLLGNELNGSR